MKRFLVESFLVLVVLGYCLGIIRAETIDPAYLKFGVYLPITLFFLGGAFYYFRKNLLKLLAINSKESYAEGVIKGIFTEKVNLKEATKDSQFTEKTLPYGRYKIVEEMPSPFEVLCVSFDNKYLFMLHLLQDIHPAVKFYKGSRSKKCFVFDKKGFTFVSEEDILYVDCVKD